MRPPARVPRVPPPLTRPPLNSQSRPTPRPITHHMPHHTHPTLTSLLFSHPPPPLPSLPPHPHPGVITLVFLILAATNFRLILENMIKYRLRFNPLTFLRTALTPSGEQQGLPVFQSSGEAAPPLSQLLTTWCPSGSWRWLVAPGRGCRRPPCPCPRRAVRPAGNLPLLLCWPLLACFALCALGIERFAVRLLGMEQRSVAASRKREVGYTEMKRAAARRASATGGPQPWVPFNVEAQANPGFGLR